MAFNYASLGNQAIENMLPLFSAMTNGAQPNPLAYPTFSQFVRAIRPPPSNAENMNVVASNTPATAVAAITAATNVTKRDHGVSATASTPQIKYNPITTKAKPNQGQGAAPMDLDNDLDSETSSTTTATTTTQTNAKTSDKLPMSMHEANLFLNGLITPAMSAATSYMFFPTANPSNNPNPTNAPTAAAATTTTTAAAAAAAASMMMDPTSMMAAAMQHLHQNFSGYQISDSTENAATATTVNTTTANTNLTTNITANATIAGSDNFNNATMKDVIKTKSCILFPPNPNAPPPTIRDRPPGCRTVFVGGLPENISEEIIREIFESCGEITTLRMSKKNFCHIRYRQETSIDRAIYLSGYRVRILNSNDPANFGRLHVDYAQARDDQYDYECKQRQLQREQRHRERISLDRMRSQSPPPMPHYTDHEASMVAENLRNNDTFLKAVQTITIWLERGDCNKRNANTFYSMIQITHGHVRHLHADKQQLEDDLRKARENYRKQMLTMSTQFTQIEKVFNAASHKKVWDHFTKAQRKNIDQWKKLALELRSIQIEDDEMEMSDEDRDFQSNNAKRARYDSENLKDENDSLRCQLEAIRNEMSLERTDLKCNSDFREKQIKVLQETIRNMQTQLLNTKLQEQRDARCIESLEQKLKEAKVKQLLLKTKIKETFMRLKDKDKDKEMSSMMSEINEDELTATKSGKVNETPSSLNDPPQLSAKDKEKDNSIDANIISIDLEKCEGDDDVSIVNDEADVVVVVQEITTNEKSIKIIEQTGSEDVKDIDCKTTNQQNINKDNAKEHGVDEQLSDTQQVNSYALLEGKIVALVATFLVVQPQGVTVEAICQHLSAMMKSQLMQPAALEKILKKYLNIFKAERCIDMASPDAGDRIGIKWKFCGFQESN